MRFIRIIRSYVFSRIVKMQSLLFGYSILKYHFDPFARSPLSFSSRGRNPLGRSLITFEMTLLLKAKRGLAEKGELRDNLFY